MLLARMTYLSLSFSLYLFPSGLFPDSESLLENMALLTDFPLPAEILPNQTGVGGKCISGPETPNRE